jgi:diguanylate cyclase (GGDEF)-like protein
MGSSANESVLWTSSLFRGVDPKTLRDLVNACGRRRLNGGETLLKPGVVNSNLYVVLSGELRTYAVGRVIPDNPVLTAGHCAGIVSAVDGGEATALVMAAMPTDLLIIPAGVLQCMLERSNRFAHNLLLLMAECLRAESSRLVDARNQLLEFRLAANIDALTGLHNRRWMFDAFPRALRRCEQDGTPACLLMVDVDHFKRINDVYGHRTGDAALRIVGRRLAESLRTHDLIARYGGDEFAIFLPETGLEEGIRVADRVRRRVAERPQELAPGGAPEPITLSCGVAARAPGMSLEELLGAADRALFRAKEAGRNRLARA